MGGDIIYCDKAETVCRIHMHKVALKVPHVLFFVVVERVLSLCVNNWENNQHIIYNINI